MSLVSSQSWMSAKHQASWIGATETSVCNFERCWSFLLGLTKGFPSWSGPFCHTCCVRKGRGRGREGGWGKVSWNVGEGLDLNLKLSCSILFVICEPFFRTSSPQKPPSPLTLTRHGIDLSLCQVRIWLNMLDWNLTVQVFLSEILFAQVNRRPLVQQLHCFRLCKEIKRNEANETANLKFWMRRDCAYVSWKSSFRQCIVGV